LHEVAPATLVRPFFIFDVLRVNQTWLWLIGGGKTKWQHVQVRQRDAAVKNVYVKMMSTFKF
jgi:hypothetical protein